MRVHWTNTALDHLLRIHEYHGLHSKSYATRIVDRLTRRSEQIGDFPNSGRRVPEYQRDDLREIVVRPYRLIYRIMANQIDVVAVMHSTQQLPRNPDNFGNE